MISSMIILVAFKQILIIILVLFYDYISSNTMISSMIILFY